MGKAYFEMSTYLLRDLLSLPENIEIVGVEQTVGEAHRGLFRILLSGDGLPIVLEGEVVPRKLPIFRRVTQQAVEFEGWE